MDPVKGASGVQLYVNPRVPPLAAAVIEPFVNPAQITDFVEVTFNVIAGGAVILYVN